MSRNPLLSYKLYSIDWISLIRNGYLIWCVVFENMYLEEESCSIVFQNVLQWKYNGFFLFSLDTSTEARNHRCAIRFPVICFNFRYISSTLAILHQITSLIIPYIFSWSPKFIETTSSHQKLSITSMFIRPNGSSSRNQLIEKNGLHLECHLHGRAVEKAIISISSAHSALRGDKKRSEHAPRPPWPNDGLWKVLSKPQGQAYMLTHTS